MPAQADLTVNQNNDEYVTVTCKRSTAGGPPEPIDLTGLTVVCIVKDAFTDDDATGTTLTSPTDIDLSDPTNGVCVVHIPAADLTETTDRVYRVDVMDGTERHTVLYGKLHTTDL